MKQVTLNIPDSNFPFFMELVQKLGIEIAQNNDFVVPEWQKEEVRKRYKNYKKDPSQALDFEQAMKEIEDKYDL